MNGIVFSNVLNGMDVSNVLSHFSNVLSLFSNVLSLFSNVLSLFSNVLSLTFAMATFGL